MIAELIAIPGKIVLNMINESAYFGRNHVINIPNGKYTDIAANVKNKIADNKVGKLSFIVSGVARFSVGYSTVEMADIATVTNANKLYAKAYRAYVVVSKRRFTNCRSTVRIKVEHKFANNSGKPIFIKCQMVVFVSSSGKEFPNVISL